MKIQLLWINALIYYELDDWEDHQQNAGTTWFVNLYTCFFFLNTVCETTPGTDPSESSIFWY